jgi:glycosyltransferase involved in cell wall biosynthesis
MIKNLEYMAYGKPVVSYDLKAGRRTLGNGALYARPNDPCDFGDKIETLLEFESLRTTPGEPGTSRRRTELAGSNAKLVAAFDDLLGDELRASDLPDYI